MINWVDFVLLIIVLIATFLGYKRGFFKTLYGLVAFFIAIFLAFSFHKPFATYLKNNTEIDEWIITNIQSYGKKVEPDQIEQENNYQIINSDENKEVLEKTLENLPKNIKETLGLEDIKNQAIENISLKVSDLAINIISILGIYVVISLLLEIVSNIVDGVLKLPILKQINEILGLLLGSILGFLQIYIIFAIITFLSSIININTLIIYIKSSLIARILYENNLILSLLF
jgi:uncharacterized membrane protein required for colicin V production